MHKLGAGIYTGWGHTDVGTYTLVTCTRLDSRTYTRRDGGDIDMDGHTNDETHTMRHTRWDIHTPGDTHGGVNTRCGIPTGSIQTVVTFIRWDAGAYARWGNTYGGTYAR